MNEPSFGANRRCRAAALLVGAAMCASSWAVDPSLYRFSDLGPGFAAGINNSGQVVGVSPVGGRDLATLWSGTAATYLSTPDGSSSSALAINDMGQVVGYQVVGSITTGFPHATLWNGAAAPIDLHTASGIPERFTHSVATGINDAGQVVGYARVYDRANISAALWNGTTRTDLPALADNANEGFATAVNDAGTVVGYGSGPPSAILWNGTIPTDLGGLGEPNSSQALAINNAGQVVGRSLADDNVEHAALWDGSTIKDLGKPNLSSGANDINDAGQIVGFSGGGTNGTNPYLAMLWEGAVATDLNSLLDPEVVDAGWILVDAKGINDSGWIAGNAYNALTGENHAFLLSVVPEPGSFALMSMGGLVALALALRRRRGRPFARQRDARDRG